MFKTVSTIGSICVLMALLGIFLAICLYCHHEDAIKPYGAVETLWLEHGVKSYDACHQFAFNDAKDPAGFNPFKAYEAWNRLHSDIFLIYPSDRVQFSYIRIAEECFRRGL